MVDKKNLENRLNDIVGLKLTEFYFQPTEEVLGGNVIVLNFGDKNRFSLHIQCFLRATFNGKIILTSSDEFFLQNYQKMPLEEYDEQNAYDRSLLSKTSKELMILLELSVVETVFVSETADVVITFNNGAKIEVIPDCLSEGYEYYRFFNLKKGSIHYIVNFRGKELVLRKC